MSGTDVDVIVAGGGPAGLFTALYAERAGLTVTVIEPRSSPIDKACGEGLMPGAVAALADLGVADHGLPPGVPFRGIRYLDGDVVAESFFRNGTGLGVRRTALHRTMHQLAIDRGIPVVKGAVQSVSQDARSVTAAGLTAGYLVAADGLHSPIRRLTGLQGPADARPRWGLRRHLAVPPWTNLVEVHWSPRAEAYVTPVGEREVAVALLTGRRAGWDEQLLAFPALRDRLIATSPGGALDRAVDSGDGTHVGSAADDTVRGAGPLRQSVRSRRSGRVLLVGDAAGYVDALTGAGIDIAARCARELVRCLCTDRPQDYEQAWRRTTRDYRWITGGLLAARRRELLRRRLVPAAARFPRVFDLAVDRLTR